MRALLVSLCFLGVFGAGAYSGRVVTVRSIKEKAAEKADPDTWVQQTIDWFEKDLQMTEEQILEVLPEIEDRVDRLKGSQYRALLGFRSHILGLLRDAERVLNEEQLELLAELRAQSWVRKLDAALPERFRWESGGSEEDAEDGDHESGADPDASESGSSGD